MRLCAGREDRDGRSDGSREVLAVPPISSSASRAACWVLPLAVNSLTLLMHPPVPLVDVNQLQGHIDNQQDRITELL